MEEEEACNILLREHIFPPHNGTICGTSSSGVKPPHFHVAALIDIRAAFVSAVKNLQLMQCTLPMNACICIQGEAYAFVGCVARKVSICDGHARSHASTYHVCAKYWFSS